MRLAFGFGNVNEIIRTVSDMLMLCARRTLSRFWSQYMLLAGCGCVSFTVSDATAQTLLINPPAQLLNGRVCVCVCVTLEQKSPPSFVR